MNVSDLSRDDFMFTDVEGSDLLPEGREPTPAQFNRALRNASEDSPAIGEPTINHGTAQSFESTTKSLLDRGGVNFDFDRYNVIVGGERSDNPSGSVNGTTSSASPVMIALVAATAATWSRGTLVTTYWMDRRIRLD